MKRNLILTCLVTLALALIFAGLARAQTGSHYDLSWGAVTGGGTMDSGSADSRYVLGGAIGQVNAGTAAGGGYTLVAGFFSVMASETATPGSNHVFLPVLLNNAANGRP